MTDLPFPSSAARLWVRLDKAWAAILVIPLALVIADRGAILPIGQGALTSLLSTLPLILFAVGAIGYLKATGAEGLLAGAFQGRETRMVVLAALVGGLSPFCSCEVIPFIAALLAAGTPLSAVMAFWLASPLMDPAMFAITAGGLGLEFAVGKSVAAVLLGMGGGLLTMALSRTRIFADPLRPVGSSGCGCGSSVSLEPPRWHFWNEPARVAAFREAALRNLLFLGKWLLLAYLLEGLMIRYVPAEMIGSVVGGPGAGPVVLASLAGAPAYLNGYAAVPLVAGLMEQGMSPGAAMSFVIAGGVGCIPAAVAVWALVRPRVFAAYTILAISGAILAGLAWGSLAG